MIGIGHLTHLSQELIIESSKQMNKDHTFSAKVNSLLCQELEGVPVFPAAGVFLNAYCMVEVKRFTYTTSILV